VRETGEFLFKNNKVHNITLTSSSNNTFLTPSEQAHAIRVFPSSPPLTFISNTPDPKSKKVD